MHKKSFCLMKFKTQDKDTDFFLMGKVKSLKNLLLIDNFSIGIMLPILSELI